MTITEKTREIEVCDWCLRHRPRGSDLELSLKGWLVHPKRLICPGHVGNVVWHVP